MQTCVVGVDGGESSDAAVRWAAGLVGDGALHEVEVDESGGADVAEVLAATAVEVDADCIVVGAHPRVPGLPRRLGRTIRSLLDAVPRPLIVIPTDVDTAVGDDAPVIVGVGAGEATLDAVRWGAGVAERTSRPLGLVRATGNTSLLGIDGVINLVASYIDPTQPERWALEDLEEFARAAQEHTSDEIEIGTTAVPGRASGALVESAADAFVLAVGLHRSEFLGDNQLGRMLRHVLTHAQSPVAVIPASDGSPD